VEPKKAHDPDELGWWRITRRLMKAALEQPFSPKKVLGKWLSKLFGESLSKKIMLGVALA
jgi:hypothetical protein